MNYTREVLAELQEGGQLWSEIHMLRVTTRRLFELGAETEEPEKLALMEAGELMDEEDGPVCEAMCSMVWEAVRGRSNWQL